MFKKLSQDKANYEKGQLFPFLTAIIVIVIIFIMITVNLGQISSFKTDASVAADAGALAGASTLSGALLGLGIKSDQMGGFALVAWVAMTIFFMLDDLAGAGIAIGIAAIVKGFVTWAEALGEGKMAWTNAKQTALSYAFNNSGIDEPRPSFKQFLRDCYGVADPRTLSAADTQMYYQRYSQGFVPGDPAETLRVLNYSLSGFGKFMQDNKRGYWSEDEFAEVSPSDSSPGTVVNGYGWNQNADGSFSNSYCDLSGSPYDDPDRHRDGAFRDYVEVEVRGNSSYDIMPYMIIPNLPMLALLVQTFAPIIWVIQWAEHGNWLQGIVPATIYMVIYLVLSYLIPFGLTMDIGQEVDGRPVHVTVRHFKREHDAGIWRFRYGPDGITEATAQGRAFNDTGDKTIDPLFLDSMFSLSFTSFDFDSFETERHLFETELTYTR